MRQETVDSFTTCMAPEWMDRFEAAGIAATWWDEIAHELQTAAGRGWRSVLEAWLTTAEAQLGEDDKSDLVDQPAIRVLACRMLKSRQELADAILALDAVIRSANPVSGAKPREHQVTAADIKKMKTERANAKRDLQMLDNSLLPTACQTLNSVDELDAPTVVLAELRERLKALISDHFNQLEHQVNSRFGELADKYAATLPNLRLRCKALSLNFDTIVSDLGHG